VGDDLIIRSVDSRGRFRCMQPRDRLPFDLWALQVFLTVCEKQSMAQAAALLGLTQPGVSQIIQDLERHLGVELFDRAMRPIALTPAGTVLRLRAGALVADARKLAPLVQKCRRGYLPAIRVGLIYAVQRLLSAPLMRVLSDAADEVTMLSGITAAHTTALLTRQLDLCISGDDLVMEAGLDRWPIVREPYIVLTPSASAAIDDVKVLTDSLPFIRYSSRSIDGPEIERYLHRNGFHVPRGAEFDTPLGLTEMVAAGLGWAITTPS
jgi:DNA-binding transcriptional LysR family regulator